MSFNGINSKLVECLFVRMHLDNQTILDWQSDIPALIYIDTTCNNNALNGQANSVAPGQTAPLRAGCSGSTFFFCLLQLAIDVADDLRRCHFRCIYATQSCNQYFCRSIYNVSVANSVDPDQTAHLRRNTDGCQYI